VILEEKFDPEIKRIEDEIIDFLLKFTIFSVRGEFISKIIFYFITRKDLTQSELQYLTGYSAGKISQELKNLIEFNLIRISKKSKPWVYTMDSVVADSLSRAISLLKANLKWEPKFLEIKKDLEEEMEELKNLNGYNEIKDFVEVNLLRFLGFKGIINLWEELKQKYETKL
jgi:DNA-binding transcriptional regulator GbsR (MarR family)